MTHRPLQLALATFFAGAAVLFAQETGKCSATARECEQEIREMLSGRRYLGAQIVDMIPGPGIVIKTVIADGPASHVDLQPGDRIIAVNGRSMMYATIKDFKGLVAEVKDSGGNLFMIVQHHGINRRIQVQLLPIPKAQIDKIIAGHLSKFHGMTPAGTGQ